MSVPPGRCGTNCYRLPTRVLSGVPARISIEVARRGKSPAAVAFRLPSRLPARGEELFRAVSRTMGTLRTVRIDQSLATGSVVLRIRYAMRAPDRVRFRTSTGEKTVLSGHRRWDWRGGRWVRGPFPGVKVPTYFWEGASSARLLGRTTVGGVPVRVLAVFRPSEVPAWLRLFVAADGHLVEAEMLARRTS